jgi:hypothetical protein
MFRARRPAFSRCESFGKKSSLDIFTKRRMIFCVFNQHIFARALRKKGVHLMPLKIGGFTPSAFLPAETAPPESTDPQSQTPLAPEASGAVQAKADANQMAADFRRA